MIKWSRTHYRINMFFLFWLSSLMSCHSSSIQRVFLSSSTPAMVGARGSYIEVRTDMRKILYGALRRVLPNPSDALVILVISKWRITITTTFIISLKNNKHGEIDSLMFKDICNWSKCVHDPIFELARRDHVVHEEICSGSIVGKIVWVLVVV